MIQEAQQHLIRLRYLDPPSDGMWGGQSSTALRHFQQYLGLTPTGKLDQSVLVALKNSTSPKLKPGQDLAGRIAAYCEAQGYWLPMGDRLFSIVYVEGVAADGAENADTPNEWNDRRVVLEISRDGVPMITGNWLATSEPGRKYTQNPMNPKGAARIQFGQYRAWTVGTHRDHEALVQVRPITVCRDLNKDGVRTGDRLDTGIFAINQHHGWGMKAIDGASAGCLVGQSPDGHREFMKLVKTDRRYAVNHSYVFYTAVIPGDKI